MKQIQDNRNIQTNQGRFSKELEGKEERRKPENTYDATTFWKGIWSTKLEHKRDEEWIDKEKEKMSSEKQNTVKITKNGVIRKLKPTPDWKEAGPDKIQSFCLKSFIAVHEVLATILTEYIEVGDVPEWFVEGKIKIKRDRMSLLPRSRR